MMTQEQKFNLDEQKLLESFINDFFFNKYPQDLNEGKYDHYLKVYSPASGCLELIVRPQCTQQCQYCYIINHGKDLYPLDERVANNILIDNCNKIFNWFETKKRYPRRLDLFAGDLFFDGLGFELFEILYNFYTKIIKIESYHAKILKENQQYFAIVGLPLNASFVEKEENVQKCLEWYQKFEDINICLNYSISVDGKYATDVREKKAESEVDKYYAKIFDFCKKTNSGIHPMISAASIENACKNYDWWYEQCHSKALARYDTIQPMTFEVRNPNEWTDDKIKCYIKYLDHLIQHRLKLCNDSIEELAYHLFIGDGKHHTLPLGKEADPIRPIFHIENGLTQPKYDYSCSFGHHFHITLNNLSIVPCHRMSYYHYIAGWLNTNEKGDLDGTITPNNVSTYIGLKMLNCALAPACQNCAYNCFCMKGCIGAQYEYSGEPLLPIPSVCKLFKEKFNFLFKTYYDMGVIRIALEKEYVQGDSAEVLKTFIQYLKQEGIIKECKKDC